MKGVVFEDNLSSHKTLQVLLFWRAKLTNFTDPQFVPANLTDIIQVIDRHIGIIYKRAVYKAVRVELMKRLREARELAGTDNGITIKALTPREKRILITRAVGDCHAKLTHYLCKTYERAFIATGTWMPVYHLLDAICNYTVSNPGAVVALGPSAIPEENQVLLQHLKKYNYVERCNKEKVISAYKRQKEEEKQARLEREQREAAIEAGRTALSAECKPFVDKALTVLEQLTSCVQTNIKVRAVICL